MHVLLIGFMCSGKSTVGKVLSQLLGLPFFDLDRVIEQQVGPLMPFFRAHGEDAFRVLERKVLDELLKGPAAVIASGGGTPCEGDNLQRMKGAGTVVWLDVPNDALMPRIERAGGDRPLLAGLKGDVLQQRVSELLASREPVYAQADIIVQAAAEPVVVAQRIAQALNEPQVR
jgi:shikimate kinase